MWEIFAKSYSGLVFDDFSKINEQQFYFQKLGSDIKFKSGTKDSFKAAKGNYQIINLYLISLFVCSFAAKLMFRRAFHKKFS